MLTQHLCSETELKILRFIDIFLFQLGKFMYLFKLGLLPEMFNGLFFTNNQMHSYNTRKSNAFHIFPCRTNLRCFAIRFQGPKFFNSLPDNIKNASLYFSRYNKTESIPFELNYTYRIASPLHFVLCLCSCYACFFNLWYTCSDCASIDHLLNYLILYILRGSSQSKAHMVSS